MLSRTFNNFFESEKSSGIFLIFWTLASFALANSSLEHDCLNFWYITIAGLTMEHWVNDGSMAFFSVCGSGV
ncbi:MAG: Na+/H+ antiporter NhaA [Ferrovum myxofaciens]|nr:MAG: Na+/H+ antiporter NhaA [Ferrovum myxofaciens]